MRGSLLFLLFWVCVNGVPVIGPWMEREPCVQSAVLYGKAHHVHALCQYKSY